MADEKKKEQPKDYDVVVAEFDKNPLDRVRIAVRMYKGKRYVDIRTYYRDDEGEYRPTKKGISLNEEFMPELKRGVKLAEAKLEELNSNESEEHDEKDEDKKHDKKHKKGKKHDKKGE